MEDNSLCSHNSSLLVKEEIWLLMALMCFSPAGGSDEQGVHPVGRY
jgi:hypothetical protein